MDYSQLSDFDIQQEVLKATWGSHPPRLLGRMMLDVMLCDFDPCNNPADAWPIIVRNQISLMYEEAIGKWCAGKPYWVDGCEWQLDIDVMEANPLRAAMIFFLIMQDANHV
ncbi:phage protein NinX family protein [Enterobacter asburiae]|uniref:phage protein NinX family protein n=1 Tax=Enterobacter asburiae TaxID=61645 RepID=UPI0021CF2BEA|nr:phage protein NinX family protein [Enterobacter asburiae]MCU6241153.1 DUF2591 family protein [Enterobacter asburiae]